MKKQIFGKILTALILLSVSTCFVNLNGQEVKLTFVNPSLLDYGNPDGIGGRIPDVQDPKITLKFSVGVAGQVSVDASTISTVQANIDAVNQWDNSNVGNTSLQSIWGKSFELILTSNKRLQLGNGGDGIGCQGTNQRRIDGQGGEVVYFILKGEVGIDFTAIEYRDINYMGGLANFEISDHDTRKKVWFMEDIGVDVGSFDVTGIYNMRYKSDSLIVTTSDTIADNNPGGRLLSLGFNIVTALPKPPAVIATSPVHADTTVKVTTDYVILFDSPMDKSVTSAAITFTPGISNRVDNWNETSDELTIKFDKLPYSTEYLVKVGQGVKGTNGLNALADTTFKFKSLPEPPKVVYTFPANLALDVRTNTPFEIRFSKSMVPDSVEKAISFNPEVSGLEFIWNSDNTTVFFSADDLEEEVLYFVTVGTVATDIYNNQFPEPFLFAFTTASTVGIRSLDAKMRIYPNPTDNVLNIKNVDVKTVRIHSITGKLIREIQASNVINVSDIKSGSYIVTVIDRNQNEHREMIMIK